MNLTSTELQDSSRMVKQLLTVRSIKIIRRTPGSKPVGVTGSDVDFVQCLGTLEYLLANCSRMAEDFAVSTRIEGPILLTDMDGQNSQDFAA